MIKLIVGQKGTGKTKTLIDMANLATKQKDGDIVFIDGSDRHMMELNHEVRFINAKEFMLSDLKVFYGFVSGIIAEDYDISQIFIDGLLELFKQNIDEIEEFMFALQKLSDKFDINFVVSMSGDPDSVPAFMKEYIA